MTRRAFAIAALAATLGGTTATAGPLIFEETAKIGLPSPFAAIGAAVEGDTIIAVGGYVLPTSEPYLHEHTYYAAFLYRRQSNGSWTYVRTLAQTDCDEGEGAEDTCHISAAIYNGVAAVHAHQIHIFRRASNGDWIAEPVNASTGPGDVDVGTGVVIASHPVCEGFGVNAFRPNQSGVWTETFTVTPEPLPCDLWGTKGRGVDISPANRWITSDPNAGSIHIFEPSGSSWTRVAELTSTPSVPIFAGPVAMDDTRAFILGPREAPIRVFNRVSGTWTHAADIAVPDSAARSHPASTRVRDLLLAGFPDDVHRKGSVSVFRPNSSGRYEEVARLVPSSIQQEWPFVGSEVDGWVDGSFARIVSSSSAGVYVYDLNQLGTTPAPTQDDFEQGNSANWTPIAGSSFSVVTSGGSRVLRQSSTTGDAGAFVTHINTTNQGIEADVRPLAFDGANRWVGLVVRRTDANNYYYLALRQSNVIELKRMTNGAFVTLASMPQSVVLNRNYRLRLEAVGTRVRAYVDGKLWVEATDTVLKQGHAGVQMYRARADFDNVVLSHNPHVALLDFRPQINLSGVWDLALGAWSLPYNDDGYRHLVQQDTAGDARALTRIAANDQIVQVAAKPTEFAAGTGSRWFGVVARYVDANNFYYVTVRRDNTISLRKVVNGAIQVLDSAPLTVSAGTTYALRLAAVGTSLRAYVNGNLVLETHDSSFTRGRYGVATYRTAGTFDEFVAWEP